MLRPALLCLTALCACTPSSDNVGDVEDTSTTDASTSPSGTDTTAASMSSTTAANTTSAETTANSTATTSDDSTTAASTGSSSGSSSSETGAQACEAIIGSMDCEALAEVSPDLTLEECQMCQGVACGTIQTCDSQYPCIDDAITLVGCCIDSECEGLSNFCGMFIGTNNICVLDDDQ